MTAELKVPGIPGTSSVYFTAQKGDYIREKFGSVAEFTFNVGPENKLHSKKTFQIEVNI